MSKIGGWPPTGFGVRLRVLREEAGLTQGELAEKAGCNLFTVAKLEGGRQEPAWPLVLALAKALGVNCLAFIAKAGEAPEARPQGRPPKPPEPEPKGTEKRGRARKPPGRPIGRPGRGE
jgi:DNA-binding XRE family transcriptional regulator